MLALKVDDQAGKLLVKGPAKLHFLGDQTDHQRASVTSTSVSDRRAEFLLDADTLPASDVG
jgi:hypothetical protein